MSDRSIIDALGKDMIIEISKHLDLKSCLILLNITKCLRNDLKTNICVVYKLISANLSYMRVFEEYVTINSFSYKTQNYVSVTNIMPDNLAVLFSSGKKKYRVNISPTCISTHCSNGREIISYLMDEFPQGKHQRTTGYMNKVYNICPELFSFKHFSDNNSNHMKDDSIKKLFGIHSRGNKQQMKLFVKILEKMFLGTYVPNRIIYQKKF